MKKRPSFSANPFILIFCAILLAGLLSFLITPGQLVDGEYTPLPRNPVNFNNLFNIVRAIPMGIRDSASIVVLILSIGGVLGVYNKTGAIQAGIDRIVLRAGKNSGYWVLALFIVFFSFLGGFFGWIEVLIPFCPLVVTVIFALGFDAVTAVAVVIVGCMGGFMAGPTNLYTVAVCNGILQNLGLLAADGNVFSGLTFRLVLWSVVTTVSVGYILLYARRVRRNPAKSLVYGMDTSDIAGTAGESVSFTWRHGLVLLTVFAAMVCTFVGMQHGIGGRKWTIDDISAVFIASGILSGLIGRLKGSEIVDAFLGGVKGAVAGALIVGFARSVYWITDNANINATIVYKATQLLEGLSPLAAAFGIVVLVSLINGLIPSGSGKAMLLGPIVFPIAGTLGIGAETSVLAYQFGDGITNMFWFSFGTLMIFLNYGKVPIQKWWKFFCPLMAIFFLIALVSLVVATSLGL